MSRAGGSANSTVAGLARAQRWLQTFVISDDERGSELAGTLVKPSKKLDSRQRAGIYRDGYWMRLEGALAVDYPCLKHCLGVERFGSLVEGYVRRRPSTSYTLNRLGDGLPRYIAEETSLPERVFLAELAGFELAMTEVFDEAETPAADAEEIQALAAQDWETTRLAPIAALRLCKFEYDIAAAQDAYKRNELIAPQVGPCRLAIHRRGYQVFRLDLNEPGYALLAEIAAGLTLGEAIERTCLAYPAVSDEDIQQWFQSWFQERLFSRLILA